MCLSVADCKLVKVPVLLDRDPVHRIHTPKSNNNHDRKRDAVGVPKGSTPL